jgi:hypothetical protein
VAVVVERAFLDQVAVGEQHGVLRLVGAQRDGEDRHHVRPVEEVGDAAKALRLALREQARARGVQARQLLVPVGAAGVAQLQREGVGLGRVVDDQLAGVAVPERHALAVGHAAQQRDLVAVQHQRLTQHVRVALDRQLRRDDGLGAVEVEHEVRLADPERGFDIVLAPDQRRRAFTE